MHQCMSAWHAVKVGHCIHVLECHCTLRVCYTGGIPVDLVAGTRDGVIPPHNIRIHYEAMKAAGLQVCVCMCVCVCVCVCVSALNVNYITGLFSLGLVRTLILLLYGTYRHLHGVLDQVQGISMSTH